MLPFLMFATGQKLLEMLEGRKGPERVLNESTSGGSGLQGYTVHVCLRWEDKTKPTLLTHVSKYESCQVYFLVRFLFLLTCYNIGINL